MAQYTTNFMDPLAGKLDQGCQESLLIVGEGVISMGEGVAEGVWMGGTAYEEARR